MFYRLVKKLLLFWWGVTWMAAYTLTLLDGSPWGVFSGVASGTLAAMLHDLFEVWDENDRIDRRRNERFKRWNMPEDE